MIPCSFFYSVLLLTLFVTSSYSSDWLANASNRARDIILHHRRPEKRPGPQRDNAPIRGVSCLFSCFRHFSSSRRAPIPPPVLVEEEEVSENYKTCEICSEIVDNSTCLQCCINGHRLHLPCFKEILLCQGAPQYVCPICGISLFSEPHPLFAELIKVDPDTDPRYWSVLESHFRILVDINPGEMASLDWPSAFLNLIINRRANTLRKLFDLSDFFDPNCTLPGGNCALHYVMNRLLEFKDQLKMSQFQEILQILLDHPRIQLDRTTGNPPRHLSIVALTLNNFQVFPAAIRASPDLDLSQLFFKVCAFDNCQVFVNHLLSLSDSFDLFPVDELFNTPLHLFIKKSQFKNAMAILNSPQCTADKLMIPCKYSSSTVIHTALKLSAPDYVIQKLLSFQGINWELTNKKKESIKSLYLYYQWNSLIV